MKASRRASSTNGWTIKVRLFVMDAEPGAKPRDLLSSTRLVALPGFGGGQGDDGQSLDALWAPDGKTVLFIASTNRDELARASGLHADLQRARGRRRTTAAHATSTATRPEIQRRRQSLFTLTEAEQKAKCTTSAPDPALHGLSPAPRRKS
jgi:hypothetical protein